MRLLLATTNTHKVREIRAILDGTRLENGIPLEFLTLEDYPAVPPPVEEGATFDDNARQKALYYAAATGELTVAEDSGLEIEALAGAPGVESARYGGPAATYPEKFALIYAALRARSSIDSPARFVCAVVVARNADVLYETRGTIDGRVAPRPAGSGGFGYDPIFFYPPYGSTLGEVTPEQKAAVSHRGKAFRALREFLRSGTSSTF